MKTNFLKPGDKVIRNNGKVLMTIIRYPKMYNRLTGWYEDKNFAVCSWYDAERGRVEEVIPQTCLSKVNSRNIVGIKPYERNQHQENKFYS